MTDEKVVEHTFHNVPPSWPHNPIIMLTQNGKNYCVQPNVWTSSRSKLKDFFVNASGLKQIKNALLLWEIPDKNAAEFAGQVWDEFLKKMFLNGKMPKFLTEENKTQ